jgi:fructosamine-3-kinase
MEKLEGDSFYKLKSSGTMPQKEQEAIFLEIGRLNKEMNEITGAWYGYIGQPEKQERSWKETFLAMMADVLNNGEAVEISLGVSYEEVRELIDKAAYSLEQLQKPSFVHWDLWDGNVFIKEGKVSGLIDFERALWGDPLMEYYFRKHCYNDKFIKGYGTDLRAEAPIRALLYDMYLYLIMVIETAYRNYPDDWQLQFATKALQRSVEELHSILG